MTHALPELRRAIALVGSLILACTAQAANTITTTTGFDYDPTTGRLLKQVIEPSDSNLCLVTEFVLDAYGHPTTTTVRNCQGSAPKLAGAVVEAAAPAASAPAVIQPRVITTTYTSDQRFVYTTQHGSQPVDTRTWDGRFGKVATDVDANGASTGSRYDGFGRKVLEKLADGTGKKYAYQNCTTLFQPGTVSCTASTGAAVFVVTATPVASPIDLVAGTSGAAIGAYAKSYQDDFGHEIRTETQGYDGGGTASRLVFVDAQYDAHDHLLKRSRPYYSGDTPSWVNYTTDAFDRVTQVQENDAAGSVTTTTTYAGLVVTTVDGKQHQTVSTKNLAGQVVLVTNNRSETLARTYDANGNLVQTVDTGGNVSSNVYDLRGRKTQSDDPDMGVWLYNYDAASELVSQTDNKSQTSTMVYDAYGHMVSRTDPDLASHWYYGAYANGSTCPYSVGRLCEETGANGYSRKTTYDSAGRVTQVVSNVGGNYSASLVYDVNGRIRKVTYPSNLSVQRNYTALGYVSSIQDLQQNKTVWTGNAQDAAGHPTQYTFGNGIVTTETFYDDGHLHTTTAGTNNLVQNMTYTYDAAGNIGTRSDAVSGVTSIYGYDDLNRLTQEDRSGGTLTTTQTLKWTYDAAGNLGTRTDAGVTSTYHYNTSGSGSLLPHAVANVTGTVNGIVNPVYGYDGDGNLQTGAGRVVAWTSYNMVQTITQGSTVLGYQYSPDHDRLKETYDLNGTRQRTTTYIAGADGSAMFYEKENGVAGTKVKHYVWTPSGVVATILFDGVSTWSTQYMHRDNVGSVMATTNDAGTTSERLAYEPFGKRRYATGASDPAGTLKGTSTDRGYTGQEEMDEVSLVNMNGRVYDPALGRFMSADPTVPYPFNGQSYNRYSYTRNNPLRANDPSGFDDQPTGGGTDGTGEDFGTDLYGPSSGSGGYGTYQYGSFFDSYSGIQTGFVWSGLDASGAQSASGTSAFGAFSLDAYGLTVALTNTANPGQTTALTGGSLKLPGAANSGALDCLPVATTSIIAAITGKDPGLENVVNLYNDALGRPHGTPQEFVGVSVTNDGKVPVGADTSTKTPLQIVNQVLAHYGLTADQVWVKNTTDLMDQMTVRNTAAIVQVRLPGDDHQLHSVAVSYSSENKLYYVTNLTSRGGINAYDPKSFNNDSLADRWAKQQFGSQPMLRSTWDFQFPIFFVSYPFKDLSQP